MKKKIKLDSATERLARALLATPPKHHDEMKLGRPVKNKRGPTKDRASSSKQRIA